MKLAGNIEDLGLGEILQIVSFSQKSGTLQIKSRKREGTLVFKNGQITRAVSTAIKQGVGEVLLKGGTVTQDGLDKARQSQSSGGFTQNLGTVLIAEAGLKPEAVEEATKKIIEKTACSFFFWRDGSFIFELTEHIDTPETIKADTLQYTLEPGLNPQFLAMEGSRLYDEYLREGGTPGGAVPGEDAVPAEAAPPAATPVAATPVAAPPTPGEAEAPVMEVEPLGEATQATAETPVMEVEPLGEATQATAPEGSDDIPFLTGDFLRELEDEGLLDSDHSEPAEPKIEGSKGLMLLKEMLEELSRPLSMSEVVLLILRFSSEIMTRAVVFGVKKGNIMGLGQYGIELEKGNADLVVRKMKVPLTEPSVLLEAIEGKVKQIRPIGQGEWNDYIVDKLGGHRTGEVFIAPVVVHGKVAVVLYADNAPADTPIGDTSSLEIFLAQTSMALEKLMLQKQVSPVA